MAAEVPVSNTNTANTANASNATFQMPTKRASLILLLGKQGSGKTHFLKSLLRDGFKAGHFKFGRVYVRTKFNKDFDFMPEKAVHQDFSLDKIQTYCNKLAKWREENDGKMVPANVLVLDDMLGLLKSNDHRWINLLANLRHYGMTIIVTSQYFAAGGCCTTQMRNQCDIALMWECRFARSRKAYFEAFGTFFQRQDEFERILDEATREKYSALVYNAYYASSSVHEMYYSFKAAEIQPFQIKFKAI